VRRDDHAAVKDLAGDGHTVYEVVLLAGSPRLTTVALGPDVEEGGVIEVDGEEWMIADVRLVDDGPARLICIYAV
jgi:hypothetical protein